jgi:hypothetical protein
VKASKVALGVVKLTAFVAWCCFVFWVFSFNYSSSFFHYNVHSRLPPFLAAFSGAVALPLSVHYQWTRIRLGYSSPLRAWLFHGVSALACVLPLLAVAGLMVRLPAPWHASADDAMGTGIDFLILVALALASSVLLGLALLVRTIAATRGSGSHASISR